MPDRMIAADVGDFEAEHWPDAALDAPVVLFDPVIQVLTLANPDRLQPAPGAILQAVCGVARNDRLQIGLAAIDDDPVGPAVTCQRGSEEPLGRWQVTLSEPEFDCIADTVDGAVEIHPLAADLDVGLVDMPFAGHATLSLQH